MDNEPFGANRDRRQPRLRFVGWVLLLLLLLGDVVGPWSGAVAAPRVAHEQHRTEADDVAGPITLRGIVRDRETRQPLPYATIALPGREVGTVSNSEGEFILKVDPQLAAKEGVVEVSHLGYRTTRVSLLSESSSKAVTVWLSPVATPLSEIIASTGDARAIVDEMMARIDRNYSNHHQLLTGFYRETARKRRHYINIAEAVIEVTKSPYDATQDISTDRVRIHRGRKLLSQKRGDTLAVKLQGGPTLAVVLDLVKSPDQLLAPDLVDCFHYRLQGVISIDERQVYVVAFYPRVILDFPLYHGYYYIDKETLTLTRAEYNLDLTDREKAIRAILRRKPLGLRFRPIEVSYVVGYRSADGGRSRLHYLRSQIDFRCDWKRRLFATEYSVLAEMVVTDSRPAQPGEITAREQFGRTHVLSDDASYFFDPDFWGDYNIIAPEESLEHAVRKLTKGQEQAPK